jgi:FAD synthase
VGAGAALVNNLDDKLDAVIAVNFTKQFADKSDNEFVETVVSLGLIKHF